MKEEQQALDYFRKLVSFLYREIGVLVPRNHEELATRRNLRSGFFEKTQRKRQARELYRHTVTQERTRAILKPYEERTGLTLEDLRRAFEEGNWECGGTIYFGGPRWAIIAETTLTLRQVIDTNDWGEVPGLIRKIDALRHNTGRIAAKFKELEG